MIKVSVLVPVYGVEKFIEQCAVTLFEQTYENIEYVFVDDCTPDDSIRVLQSVLSRYPHRQQQVNIVRHEYNRGLGAARKTALDAATGDFVFIVDSDDYVSVEAVARLVECQKATGADIVTGAFNYKYDDGSTASVHYQTLDQPTVLKLMLIQNTLLPHIWGRLYRRTLFTDHGIAPVEGINMAEDLAVTPRLIYAAKTIAVLDEALYVYRCNSSASTFDNHLAPKHLESYLKACEVLMCYFSKHDLQGKYRYAFEIGMLHATYISLKGGFDRQRIRQFCAYRPQGWLFRLVHLLFAHRRTLPLLRLSFLSVKWLFKKRLHYAG